MTPPADVPAFAGALSLILYAVSCGGVTATGWSADSGDDTVGDWDTSVVTTSSASDACAAAPGDMVVRQGDDTFVSSPWVSAPQAGLGMIAVAGDRPWIDWDYVPMPRRGQWVGIGARSADGAPLRLLERRILKVGRGTFTLNAEVGTAYLGAPVVDNMGRTLGVVTAAGTQVTGTPRFCDSLFVCDDPDRVWWDITAPSAARKVTAVPGKRSVTVTWKPAASDGGAEVAYWYRIGGGEWTYADGFSVTVRARTGERVSVTVGTVNDAGPGPTVTVSARAR